MCRHDARLWKGARVLSYIWSRVEGRSLHSLPRRGSRSMAREATRRGEVGEVGGCEDRGGLGFYLRSWKLSLAGSVVSCA